MNDTLIGGSTVEKGSLKAMITAVGENTVLANILKLVREAQTENHPYNNWQIKSAPFLYPL